MRRVLWLLLFMLLPLAARAQEKPARSAGKDIVQLYLDQQVLRLAGQSLDGIDSLEIWRKRQPEYRRQLFDMLGLDPLPEKTDLHATVTGQVEHDEFTVEKVHFQSRPRLYVTGNLYVPKNLKGQAPAILYLCGHGAVKKDGVSYGNKVHYQHHGAWYARHGYVCLIIDSLQLGEIEGLHHGTHRENLWHWGARGYTPAGVEAWNCIRALDYLQSRPEVDGERLGATGRSGGGAYTWWITALDERVKAAVPVAGITDLQNHVTDGVVDGHCDCMFVHNTYHWDYPQVAALVAPRPLLISNTDRDGIFPLDGVYRTFEKTREIYKLHNAAKSIGFNITPGEHKDTPELQVSAFRWFDQHLMQVDRPLTKPAEKFFSMEQLKVFEKLPDDQINTRIHDLWIPAALTPAPPASAAAWKSQSEAWQTQLKQRVFRALPQESLSWLEQERPVVFDPVAPLERDNLELRVYKIWHDYGAGAVYVLNRAKQEKPDLLVLNVLDEASWAETLATLGAKFPAAFDDIDLPPADEKGFQALEQLLTKFNWSFAYYAPLGVGPTAWSKAHDKQVRRRFLLLGQTPEGARVEEVRRVMQGLRSNVHLAKESPLWLQSQNQMAGVALAASLLEPPAARLDLYDLPKTLDHGPYFFNAQRYLDMPALVALAAERSRVVIYQDEEGGWEYPQQVVEKLGWDKKQLQLRKKPQPMAQ